MLLAAAPLGGGAMITYTLALITPTAMPNLPPAAFTPESAFATMWISFAVIMGGYGTLVYKLTRWLE